ncbi:DNA replication/repair protein RecF [Dethiosulfovibrio salsuginis]|uniref:DNA replication and repair protein RecF n=1 Tax=Dethiosulfovibrio salsuginis TaxID=561720 RepID=A0A1X7JEU0_9BACT|nr:DNA replication and repair protein RecF [Dethiosulfovibrio salsuginis]SMG26509.1 DNA replication and repair protein RecF [Dethiosulfovibrio salsuginis]
MFFKETGIKNFKNIALSRLSWNPGLNLVLGPNGSGKTNLIETLNILSGWGPFKSAAKSSMVNWDSDDKRGFLQAVAGGEEEVTVQTSVTSRCSMKCDDKRSNCSNIRLKIPTLSFLTEDMALIEGSPAVRRRFMDVLCAVIYPMYALRLTEYRRAIAHKKALLVSGRSTVLVDRAVAPMASWIWSCRDRAVKAIRMGLEASGDLPPGQVSFFMERGGGGLAEDGEEDYYLSVDRFSQRERGSIRPLVGPHRDDLKVLSGSMAASSVFSRGQRRRLSISLIVAAGWVIQTKLKKKPILLLDEVASELDPNGRRILVETLKNLKWQVIAATAEENVFDWPGAIWNADKGDFYRKEL